jgi:hypothetical protein
MDFGLAHRFRQQFVWLDAGLGLRLGVALLALGVAASSHAECGTPSGIGRVAAVDDRLDISLQDGRLVRLAGLDASDSRRVAPETADAARKFLTDSRQTRLRFAAEMDNLSSSRGASAGLELGVHAFILT